MQTLKKQAKEKKKGYIKHPLWSTEDFGVESRYDVYDKNN